MKMSSGPTSYKDAMISSTKDDIVVLQDRNLLKSPFSYLLATIQILALLNLLL